MLCPERSKQADLSRTAEASQAGGEAQTYPVDKSVLLHRRGGGF